MHFLSFFVRGRRNSSDHCTQREALMTATVYSGGVFYAVLFIATKAGNQVAKEPHSEAKYCPDNHYDYPYQDLDLRMQE